MGLRLIFRYDQVVQIRNVASGLFLAVNENGELCWREGGKECWFMLTSPDGKVARFNEKGNGEVSAPTCDPPLLERSAELCGLPGLGR